MTEHGPSTTYTGLHSVACQTGLTPACRAAHSATYEQVIDSSCNVAVMLGHVTFCKLSSGF